MKLAILLLLTFSFLFHSKLTLALEVPQLTGPVVDQANLLAAKEQRFLADYIRAYKTTSGNQLQVLIIKSLEGDNLERFSIAVTDKWQLGGKAEDNGALFLVSVEDRLTRIEVGQGLEGVLTDFTTRKILNNLKPYYQNNEFATGTFFVLAEITKAIDGQIFQPKGSKSAQYAPNKKKKRSLLLFFLQFILFGGFIFLSRFSRYGRHSHYGVGGFGGGYSGGGGFSGGGWSGGGGGFSGGGSSSSW